MTIDMIEATPEQVHTALAAPATTARGIAYSSLAIAHSDLAKACEQLRIGTVEEALEIMGECEKQIELARRMVTGTIWML